MVTPSWLSLALFVLPCPPPPTRKVFPLYVVTVCWGEASSAAPRSSLTCAG